MGYYVKNFLPKGIQAKKTIDFIELLGYQKQKNNDFLGDNKVRNVFYYWFSDIEFCSFHGVELCISLYEEIIIETRVNLSGSYYDLEYQRNTARKIKEFLGGYFTSSCGKNRFYKIDHFPHKPSLLSHGCYLAKWSFHNDLIKLKYHLEYSNTTKEKRATGLPFLDELNSHLFINNLLLTYLIAVWETFLRMLFVVLLKNYSDIEQAIKNINTSVKQIARSLRDGISLEQSIADSLSFQRPEVISKNFQAVEFDIRKILKKPYRNTDLFESINSYVSIRNDLSHCGQMDFSIEKSFLKRIINEFDIAVERIYRAVGIQYNFQPLTDAITYIPNDSEEKVCD